MADYGLYFDGEDDYVSTTTTEAFSSGLTIVAILKYEGIPRDDTNYDWMAIATKKKFNDDWGLLQEVKSNIRRFTLFINDTKVVEYPFSLSEIQNNRVYFVAATYDGSTAKLYKDGTLLTSASSSVSIPDNYDEIYIGKSVTNYPLDGKIYLVLIYNRALSDTEIQAIYENPTNPPTDGLVLWLAPDSVDTANDVWTDKSGNSNDGTIYGCLYIPTRWTTKDGVLTIEEIWELNTVRFNYPWPVAIKNKINRVVEVIPTLNNTYVVFDKALGGEEVTFTFYLDPDYDDDEKIRSEILSSGIVKIRTPDLRYYSDYVVKSIDWDIDAFNKYILKITAVRV